MMNTIQISVLRCLLWAMLLAFAPTLFAAQQADADKALQSIGSPKWYDRVEDGYAPPELEPEEDNPIRTEGWIAEEENRRTTEREKKKAANAANATRGGAWNWTGLDTTWFSTIVISFLGITLVTIILLLAYHSLRTYMPGRWEKTEHRKSIVIDPAKVSDLPFEVKQATYENPLAEAEALMRSGKYREAILFLYGYMLLALDQSRKIDLQKGKTNRMYLRELKSQVELRSIVETAMLSFEDVYFGKHAIGEQQFLISWNQVDDFHRLLTGPSSTETAQPAEIATA